MAGSLSATFGSPTPLAETKPATLELVELLLKRPDEVDQWTRRLDRQRELLPRLLLIGEAGSLAYACVMVLLLNLAPAAAYPGTTWLACPPASWSDGSALGLVAGYGLGMLLAACVCLPSFYFYSLLAGVRLTAWQITSLIARGTAANAVLLLGLLPAYVTVALGMIVVEAPVELVRSVLTFGLVLPFLAGLWGLHAIYRGVQALSADLPPAWQCGRRCFLRRLTLSWAAVYTAVVPVMIHRLWSLFVGL